jgi:O-antigen/teichoic acid export membrane protein
MDPITSILRNSALLMAAKVLSAAMGLVLVAVLPRLLGDTQYGQLHLAISLVAMVGVAVDFGLTQVLARAVARDHAVARSYVGRAAAVTLSLGVLLYVALLAALQGLDYPAGVVIVVAILGIDLVVGAAADLLVGLYQGHERMLVPAVARIVGNAVTLAPLVYWLASGTPVGTTAVAWVLVASSLVRLALQGWGLRGLEGLRTPRPARLPWRGLLAAGLPFLLWQSLGVLYFRIDVIMLGHLTSAATVGWYGAASRLVDGLTFIADVIALTSFPVLARLWVSAPAEFQQVVRRTLNMTVVAAAPIVIALLVLAPEIVDTLFSEQFRNTVPILRIHALTLGLLFLDYVLATMLMAIGRERAWLTISILACVLNPLLNLVAIRATQARYGNGGIGAALASLTTELCVAGCALALVPRGSRAPLSAGQAIRLGLAAGAMAAAIGAGMASHAPWLLAGSLGGLLYLGLVLRFGLLPADLLSRVRAAVSWRPVEEVVS